jgi:hypothetical protein
MNTCAVCFLEDAMTQAGSQLTGLFGRYFKQIQNNRRSIANLHRLKFFKRERGK